MRVWLDAVVTENIQRCRVSCKRLEVQVIVETPVRPDIMTDRLMETFNKQAFPFVFSIDASELLCFRP